MPRLIRRLVVALAAASVLLAACGNGAVGDTAATVNDESISRSDVTALRTTYEGDAAVNAGCGPSEEGDCFQDFRGDLTRLILAEALSSAAEADFGLTWTDEDIAERITHPPDRDASLFDRERLPEYFTDEVIAIQALFTLIRDDVATALLLETADFPDAYLAEPQRVTQACVRHVLVPDEEAAIDVLVRVEAGEALGDLADELSIDTTTRGGLLLDPNGQCPTFLSRYFPEFAIAAVEAPIGTATGPVQTEAGYHVILVEVRVGPPTREELIADPVAWLEPAVTSGPFTEWLNVALREADIVVHPAIGTWSSTADAIRPPPSS